MAKNVANTNESALELIDRNIASIRRNGKKLRNDCHETLVMVIDHYIAHGDYTRLPKLVAAVKESLGGSLSQAMNGWVARFVPSLRWNDTDKAFENIKGKTKEVLSVPEDKPIKMKSVTGPDEKPVNFYGDARKLPFYELEREVEQKPFDFTATLKGLIARASKALEDNQKNGKDNHITGEQLLLLKKAALGMGVLKKEDFTAAELDENTSPAVETPTEESKQVEQIADAA